MSEKYLIIGIFIATFFTLITRIIPFLFYAKRKPGEMIRHIELFMPTMIMVILVFYAIKDVNFTQEPYGLPEIVSIFIAGILHVMFRQALLSVVIATVSYMYINQILL